MISKNLEYIFLNLQFIKPTKTQLYYCQWQDPMCKKPKKKKKKWAYNSGLCIVSIQVPWLIEDIKN